VVVIISALLALSIEETGSGSNVSNARIAIFCTADNCLFGWLSGHWVGPLLIFGFVIGVVCVAGFNYAVSLPPIVN
jgi:hypothetical protein